MPVLAILALLLAFIFHGTGFTPDLWWNWQGMELAGVVLLAWCLLEIEIPRWRK